MYKKIIVPLDGSDFGESVLPNVLSLTSACETGDIKLVRVLEPVATVVGDYVVPEKQANMLNADLLAAAEKYLADVAKRLDFAAWTIETKVLEGPAVSAIADFAEKEHADVIVLAAHEKKGLRRWFDRDIAAKLIQNSCVPVLTVRTEGCLIN